MKKSVPDWVLQLTWFIAAFFATGAFWYFLSQKSVGASYWSAAGAVGFALVAVALHLYRDRSSAQSDKEEEVVLTSDGETVRFSESLRSLEHDVVIVHATTHRLGVLGEYEWIKRRYPGSEVLSQGLTSLRLITGNRSGAARDVYFDLMAIKLQDGRTKEIYFDISAFFDGKTSSALDPTKFIARKLADLYKAQTGQHKVPV